MPQTWYDIKAMGGGVAEVLIYEEIGGWGISAKEFARDLKDLGNINQIDLRINSPGGSVFDGNAIFNQLKQHPAKVTAYIDGLAASMASVVAMAADHVVMPGNALMMIHNPWTVAIGNAEELRKNADLLDTIKKTLLKAYGRSMMTDEEISEMMDAETWLTGADAVEMGFADELEEEVAMAACAKFDQLAQFQKTPQQIQPKPSAVADKPQAKHEENAMPTPNQATETTVDEKEIHAKAQAEFKAAQAQRVDGIKAAFDGFEKHIELRNQCIEDFDCSVEDARAHLLTEIGKDQKPSGSVHVGDEGNQAKVKAMADVVAMRAGLKTAEEVGENAYRGKTLLGMAEACLEARGKSVSGMGKMDIVAAAFTHSSGDFSKLLSNTANKSMLKGYAEAEEVFTQFTSVGNLPDFKTSERVDLNEVPSLRKVREGAEYKHITIGERGETVQLATYGELFGITRQAIINDDLSVFTRIPQKMGRAARRTVADLVFDQLTSNPVMSDGTALFHADHNNLKTGTGLTVSTFDAMKSAIAVQKNGAATLNIRPRFLLVPVALESTARTLMASQFDPSKTQRVPNPIAGMAEVITDARLDAVSAAHWYMLADPMMYDTIEVQYLDGNPNPVLEQQDGWNIDGVEFKVRMDAGAKALDFRTMAKNAG
ncbi:ClpP-like prohead protease/major capsid protein fusion protein [Marinobacter salarius]|uniref:ClpP-like prohead protease/major capsid protein fusion protein n=1 Tax=Marinobacter salarius TaxID=1420917 RepID=UPI003BA8F668